jgi:hypothetical protein
LNTIKVTYEINIPDDANAVGGTLVAEHGRYAIANIEHADGSVSAWLRFPRMGMPMVWYRTRNDDRFITSDHTYVVIDNQWQKEDQ